MTAYFCMKKTKNTLANKNIVKLFQRNIHQGITSCFILVYFNATTDDEFLQTGDLNTSLWIYMI